MRKGMIYNEVLKQVRVYLRQNRVKTTRLKQDEVTQKFLQNWRKEYLSNDEILDKWLKEYHQKLFI